MLITIAVLSNSPYKELRKAVKARTGIPWSRLSHDLYWKEVNYLRGCLDIRNLIPNKTEWTKAKIKEEPILVPKKGSLGLISKDEKYSHIMAIKKEKVYDSHIGKWVSIPKWLKNNQQYRILSMWGE